MRARIPPVIIVLFVAAAMWLVARTFDAASVDIPLHRWLAALLMLVGIVIAVAGVREFRRAQTTVNPMAPESATALVNSGVFRLSRNPMYAGMLLVLLGWGVALQSLAGLALVAVFVVLITVLQIKPEERALLEVFGEDYRRYCRQVRRWL